MRARLVPFAAALAVMFSLLAGVTSAHSPARIGPSTLVGVRDLGQAPSSVRVRVAVVLNYHHDAELERLIEAQADPDSPLYHRFLSSQQFAGYFAPTPREYASVVDSLRRGGLEITHTFANRTVVDAAAPAPVAAHYFGTSIHRVVSPEGRLTYANVRSGVVPAEIGPLVYAVVGLDAVPRLRPLYALPRQSAPPRFEPQLLAPSGGPLYGPYGGYGPQVFINSYDEPAQKGIDGKGRASGVATDSDFVDGDLSTFLSYFQINRTGPTTKRVNVDGGSGGVNNDATETTLDVETIVSLAPGTALYVYEAPYDEPSNANFIDIYEQAVDDNKVDTLNSSYGYCETGIDQYYKGYSKAADAIEKQGGALGITFHAASGDWGPSAPGCSSNLAVIEPASTPHNVAVGGTTLSVDSNGNETSEIAWSGTGGGVSVVFPVPSYQKGVKNVLSSGRNIPDLTFDADPNTGVAFYEGGWGSIGGTSLASPIFGGSLTQVDEMQKSRAGWFDVTMYKTWLKHGYNKNKTLYFRDITSGGNGYYNAETGYDQVSGIGAMQVANFAALLPHK